MIDGIKICISGIQGYAGKTLAQLVLSHPYLKLAGILTKKLDTKSNIPIYSIDEIKNKTNLIDVLLLATPPEASIETITLLKNTPIKIIDLSGAFRLSQRELHQWYGMKQNIPAFVEGALYGLSPWAHKNKTNKPMTVLANPGCYATCALMSLIPLLQNNIIKETSIIIDAKSGVSGAGKKAKCDLMFCEISENFFPYKIGKHPHQPEIKKALSEYAKKNCSITLSTNMLPIKTGIAMSIYADANSHFDSDKALLNAIKSAYHKAYYQYPLIKFDAINQGNLEKDRFLLSLKNVVGTPYTHIGYFVKDGKIILFASIDNLLKGAASQAIENINALYHWPLETGLLPEDNNNK